MLKVTQPKIPGYKEPSKLEQAFRLALRAFGSDLPDVTLEHCFVLAEPAATQALYVTPKTKKPRRWAFDFCWPQYRLAVEIDGGMFMKSGGRHNSAVDRAKMAAASRLGWLVIHFTAPELRDSKNCIELVRAALEKRGWKPVTK